MIQIVQGAENTFDLTLTEKSTLTNPYYLFVFNNDLTKEPTKKIIADTSSYARRYNRFIVTEGTDITFNPTGYWHYKVYEQSSSSNTNEALSTKLVEEGKCNVTGTATTHSKRSTTRTYKGYGKGST